MKRFCRATVCVLALLAATPASGNMDVTRRLSETVETPQGGNGSASAVNHVNPERLTFTTMRTDNVPFGVQGKSGLRVFVDAGHGGHDLGAPGAYGLLEKDVVLRIARLLETRLKSDARARGVSLEVRLSRETDVFLPLRERVRLANAWGADAFVSIHANSSRFSKVKGFEVYFLNGEASDADATNLALFENAADKLLIKPGVLSILEDVRTNLHVHESAKFAEVVYRAMVEKIRPNKRGVRQAPFTVLAGTSMPALLIEVGYVTNLEEAKKLKQGYYLKRIAEAVGSGVLRFVTSVNRSI